jgi:hypothetical protein
MKHDCGENETTISQPLDKNATRAKLMSVSAIQIGKVGGAKLTVKTAKGEFPAPVTELHDAWWNSIPSCAAGIFLITT